MPSEPGPDVIIRPPGREPYRVTLARLTEHVRAARGLRHMAFLDKMQRAGNVVVDLETAAERRADALLARGAELAKKADKAFTVHEQRADQTYDALDRFEHAIDVLGNGAPVTGSDVGAKPASLEGTPYAGTNGDKTQ